MALTNRENIGVAYTYNEPIIWYEYMLDTARIAQERNLKNVMVTNGFVSIKPLEELMSLIDAFSVDLKAFTDEFYRKITHSRLEPVKEALKTIRKSGKHLEITNLIIPTLNDDKRIFEEMCRWIYNELGKDTILHLSRYYPTYKMTIEGTPLSTLLELHDIARTYLDYVYLGNVSSKKGNDTACNNCGHTVIHRDGYWVSLPGLDDMGNCRTCGNRVVVMGEVK
jgi:pyruvate formate lyase activating enzyme